MKLVKRIIIYSLVLVFLTLTLSSCKARRYYYSEEKLRQDLDYMAIVYLPKYGEGKEDFRVVKELSDEETQLAINRICQIEFVTPIIGTPIERQDYSFAFYKTDGTVMVISWCGCADYRIEEDGWSKPYKDRWRWCEKEMFLSLIEEFGVDIIED